MSSLFRDLPAIGSEWVVRVSPWILGTVVGLEDPVTEWHGYLVTLVKRAPNLPAPETLALSLSELLTEWQPNLKAAEGTTWELLLTKHIC